MDKDKRIKELEKELEFRKAQIVANQTEIDLLTDQNERLNKQYNKQYNLGGTLIIERDRKIKELTESNSKLETMYRARRKRNDKLLEKIQSLEQELEKKELERQLAADLYHAMERSKDELEQQLAVAMKELEEFNNGARNRDDKIMELSGELARYKKLKKDIEEALGTWDDLNCECAKVEHLLNEFEKQEPSK